MKSLNNLKSAGNIQDQQRVLYLVSISIDENEFERTKKKKVESVLFVDTHSTYQRYNTL